MEDDSIETGEVGETQAVEVEMVDGVKWTDMEAVSRT